MFLGAMFLPPEVMMISFLRPVICREAVGVEGPEVARAEPPPSIAARRWPSGSWKYPRKTLPLHQDLPSSPRRTSTPGIGVPAEP